MGPYGKKKNTLFLGICPFFNIKNAFEKGVFRFGDVGVTIGKAQKGNIKKILPPNMVDFVCP